jgi:hypothetical protein
MPTNTESRPERIFRYVVNFGRIFFCITLGAAEIAEAIQQSGGRKFFHLTVLAFAIALLFTPWKPLPPKEAPRADTPNRPGE